MANTRISDLTASASNLASTDLAPVVQTVGVGPVKMTGAQIAAGLLSATTPIGSDPILSRGGSATLQLGAADAAAPVAQFFKVQGVVAGTSNTAGANFTIQGSQGTGTGAGGSIIFQVAPAGSSGTAQNAYSTALTIASDKSATIDSNILLGKPGAVSNYGVWFGTTAVGSPSDTNYTFMWNSSFLLLNAPSSGTLYLRVGNTDYMNFGSNVIGISKITTTTQDFLIRSNSNKLAFGTSDDVQLSRPAAGVLKLTGASSAGCSLQYSGYTYATLPTAAVGIIAYVTDGGAASYAVGDTVNSGGGTTKVMVYCDGTNWKALTASF